MIERLRTKNFASGTLFGLIGAAGLVGSLAYPLGTARMMGPGYFPALVFGILLLLGLVIAGKALAEAQGEPLEALVWRPLLLILGALVLFALALERAGFVVACMGLVLIATAAGTTLGIARRLLLAASITLFCWLIFIEGLGLLIPTWPDFAR